MENEILALPNKSENLHHIWNKGDQKYDVIDLNTGKLVRKVDSEASSVDYSPLMADIICDMIRDGMTLTKVCESPNMPSLSRFYSWLAVNPELRKRYEQARIQRADAFHDKALDIALSMPEKDMIPAAKLAVDTLKWSAEKNDPDRFGAKKVDIAISQPSVIILNTGIDRGSAPSIDDLLRKNDIIDGEFNAIDEAQILGEQNA